MQTSEVLYAAADLIEERGWGQGSSPGLCASNAIRAVAQGVWPHEDQYRERDTQQQALAGYLGGRGCGDIFDWNDAPERTAEQVIATLRAAAVIEAAKEHAEVRKPVTSDA